MSALIQALDNFTTKQFGENGHIEYGWSNSIKEQIMQFYFQLVRCDETKLQELDQHLHQLLVSLMTFKEETNEMIKLEKLHFLSILYRMIGYTRDIIDGKGEYTLSYMMIYRWHMDVHIMLSAFMVNCFVDLKPPYFLVCNDVDTNTNDTNTNTNTNKHPYGSWKDLPNLCNYVKEKERTEEHLLITWCVNTINNQLKIDEKALIEKSNISLVAKWVPREKSKYGWLFNKLAFSYFSEFLATAYKYNREQRKRAENKCKTYYRQLVSKLNNALDTTQIKQCSKNWANIDFNHVTSITLAKQHNAFLNKTKRGKVRSNEIDRIQCAKI
jgi:hypothetical protein